MIRNMLSVYESHFKNVTQQCSVWQRLSCIKINLKNFLQRLQKTDAHYRDHCMTKCILNAIIVFFLVQKNVYYCDCIDKIYSHLEAPHGQKFLVPFRILYLI